MKKKKLGFAMCGSFCTFSETTKMMKYLTENNYEVYPIMSYNAYDMDTRFGKAKNFIQEIETITEKQIINTIIGAEPIGPKDMFDILLVAPCTGNTLAKLAHSVTDTPVTMAVKSHLRGEKPVVVAVSTNDALSGSAKNIGMLLNYKNYYFVPMRQDNPTTKPSSMVAYFDRIPETLENALVGKQTQPIIK